jgi:hypothetical protein
MEVTPLLKPLPAQEQRSNNIVTALLQAPGTATGTGTRRRGVPSGHLSGPGGAASPWTGRAGARGSGPTPGRSGRALGVPLGWAAGPRPAEQNLHAARFGAATGAVGCSTGRALPGCFESRGGWCASARDQLGHKRGGGLAGLLGPRPPAPTAFSSWVSLAKSSYRVPMSYPGGERHGLRDASPACPLRPAGVPRAEGQCR